MLDPLTALGLAGNVIQIADVTWKLVSGARELHTSGSLSALTAIKTDAETVYDQAVAIRTLLEPTIGCLTKDEAALHSLSKHIESTSEDLLVCVTLNEQQTSIWNNIKGAAKAVKKKRKIAELAGRLERLQSQLGLRILVALRTSLSEQSNELQDQYGLIHDDIKHIIHVLEGTRRKAPDVNTDGLPGSLPRQSFAASTALNDRTQDALDDNAQGLKSQELLPQTGPPKTEFGKNLALLRLLRYRHMQDRRDEIQKAHRTTFEWIFQENADSTLGANFLRWLHADSMIVPYWINGKAGSGKSTLMRFLVEDPRTRTALSKGSGSDEFTIASCFFWNLGTAMQKSHQGLLQSLLYTVLEKHPSAIPGVFADIWDSLWDKETDGNMPPLTLVELKRAFSALVNLDLPFKMCFFVDGIDEYDGDHVDICSFLMSTCSERVKLVLSSRPINACIEAFRHCPSLRLEDLTYPDIKQFVDDRLARHEKMQHLLKTQPLKATVLVEELVAKASGVFLWVRLVVKSLLDGLRNDDQVSDLLVRLRLIPPDLENLYKHMLGKMSPLYREQAAQLFQIIQYSRELWVNRPVKTLLLSYAEFDPQICLQMPLGPVAAAEALQRCRAMENRLRSRCCGLLETRYFVKSYSDSSNQTSLNDESSASGRDEYYFVLTDGSSLVEEDREVVNSNVQYLHRTVAEFLHRKDVWSSLMASEGELSSMSITTAVGHATLVKLKISPFTGQDSVTWALKLLKCCKTAEAETHNAQVQIIDELDRVMHHHWHGHGGWGRNHWAPASDCNTRYHHMFALAVRSGLGRYVEEKLNDLGPDLIHCGGMPLMRQLIVAGPSFDEVPCMASLLLRYGADSNEMYEGLSTWQFAMHEFLCQAEPSNINAWISLLSLFVLNGADVNAPIYAGSPGTSSADWKKSSMSPLSAVRQVHRRLLAGQDVTASTATTGLEDILLEYGAQLNLDRDRVRFDEIPSEHPADPAPADEISDSWAKNLPARDHSSMTAPVWKLAAAIFADETIDPSEYQIGQAKVNEISTRKQPAAEATQEQGGARILQDALSRVQSVVDEGVKDLRYHMGQGDKIPKWHFMAQGYLPRSVRWLH
ncbi:uncharacterized protein Z520_04407 [Fonsecaea multimorphosa CBS 102226]|uniref:Uncharacterized protein n=1 Tax=Fonsecaea multimorphosa CBS 102226 TaxID=1442371 RepID=A0A0D2IRZ3_9EURO|nr:uncharacterized protein Z520_04407 [Fonsecaea multimorphosa CBS 102226]KIX99771.1 hypothetical protein Z520_04407 [Fonsecaea multimorphosa CBS 102226]OAL26559.1 hypothetical protein AYO22_04170 [Fonsecaea multimorphosa]